LLLDGRKANREALRVSGLSCRSEHGLAYLLPLFLEIVLGDPFHLVRLQVQAVLMMEGTPVNGDWPQDRAHHRGRAIKLERDQLEVAEVQPHRTDPNLLEGLRRPGPLGAGLFYRLHRRKHGASTSTRRLISILHCRRTPNSAADSRGRRL